MRIFNFQIDTQHHTPANSLPGYTDPGIKKDVTETTPFDQLCTYEKEILYICSLDSTDSMTVKH